MKTDKISQIILKAQLLMKKSHDPVHEFNHAQRVVKNVENLCANLNITQSDTEALIIAAWWHDTSRTLVKIPSALIMPIVDDMLSAILLFLYNLSLGIIGGSSGKAARLIMCKSWGTGHIFKKFLIKKKNILLLNILKDADSMDIINTERIQSMVNLLDKNKFYCFGYKTIIWWNLKSSNLFMKTESAKVEMQIFLEELLEWIQKKEIQTWHINKFGEIWTKETVTNIISLLDYFELNNLKYKINSPHSLMDRT